MKRAWYLIPALLVLAGLLVYWQFIQKPAGGPATDSENNTTQTNQPLDKTPSSNETIQINWLGRWMGEHDRETFLREVVNEYQFLHPEITLNMKFHQEAGFPNEKTIAAKIADMIRTGQYDWDIVPCNTGQYRDVAQLLDDPQWGEKYLVDFQDVPGFRKGHKSFIINDPQYRKLFGGMFVGPYIEGFYCMLWYNKDVADRIGITIKQHGLTIDDVISYVHAVRLYNEQNGTHIAAIHEAKDWRTTEYLFRHLYNSAVGDLEALRSDTASDTKNAALLRTFQALEQLGAETPLSPTFNENVWWDTRHLVLDGEALFFVNGSWMYSHWMNIDETKTMKMMPAELPVFQPTDFYTGSYTPQFAVLKASPNRDTAVDALMSMARPKIAEKWVRYTKAPTGIQGNLATSDVADDQFEQFQYHMNKRYGGRLHFSDNVGYILGAENQLLTSVINEQVIALLAGTTTAQEAYNAVRAQCK